MISDERWNLAETRERQARVRQDGEGSVASDAVRNNFSRPTSSPASRTETTGVPDTGDAGDVRQYR